MKRPAAIACLVALSSLAFVATRPAHAWPPPGTPHVDPGAPGFRWPAPDWDGDGIFDRLDHCNETPKGCIVDPNGCETDADGDGVCDGLDQCPATPRGTKVDSHGCHAGADEMAQPPAAPAERAVEPAPSRPTPPPAPVSEVERKLIASGRLRLENVYFETNSANLLPESESTLNEVGGVLEKFAHLKIEVEGHTDTRGRAAYNLRLSQKRAESVRGYLLEHFKLEPANLTARGYGEARPETKKRNEEEMLRNRRVELRVLNPEVLPKGVQVEKK